MSSLGGDKLIDQFKTKILNYFDSFKSDKNIFYLDYLEDIIITPGEKREYTVSLPVSKGRKTDFAMETVEATIPTLATLKFKDFPLKQVMVRIEFPNVLFGVNGMYPKIIFTTELPIAWPGDFGILWEGLTGVPKFFFYPYEDRENKVEDLIKFYQEGILDPLCDFLNTGTHLVAEKVREGLHEFLRLTERARNKIKTIEDDAKDHPWYYVSPFDTKRKGEKNVIDVPIYCNFFDEQNTSILYFEAFGLKKTWIPPADVIFNILQYIVLASEMFDMEGKLKGDEELKRYGEIVKNQAEKAAKLERKKQAAESRAKWDPFKKKKEVERDGLGFAVRQEDGIVLKQDDYAEKQIEKMKSMLHTTPSMPKISEPKKPVVDADPSMTKPETDSIKPLTTTSQPTNQASPSAPAPVPPVSKPTAPKPAPTPPPTPATTPPKEVTAKPPEPERMGYKPKFEDTLKQVEEMKKMMENVVPQKSKMEVPEPELQSQTEPAPKKDPSQFWSGLKDKIKKQAQPAPTPIPPSTTPTPTPSSSPTPSVPSHADPKEWFAEFQMRKFELSGDATGLNFREKGDFKLLQTLSAPFMLSFARDKLRNRKSITSTEAIKILFKFLKEGRITPV